MQIITNLNSTSAIKKPIVFAIGNFDGVHLGHQVILKRIKELAALENSLSGVITFSNHPTEILQPHSPTTLICSLEHKKKLLKEAGVDVLVLFKFTQEFANQSSESFLKQIHQTLPFTHLNLGYDGHIGKNKEGNFQKIQELGRQLHFKAEQNPPLFKEEQPISSSRIRELIKKGRFKEIEPLLGRPYSIYGEIVKGLGLGKTIGYPTININVDGLCLPPLGVYTVKVIDGDEHLIGAANLGIAPTVRKDSKPILEVHLLNTDKERKGHFVEVVFEKFLRSEKKFDSLEQLKNQIKLDLERVE